jgi:hypothetical protein
MRAEGMLLREIGEHFGVGDKAIHAWLNDPHGTAQAARSAASAERCAGQCVDCGTATHGSRGRINAPERCPTCAYDEAKVWTREAIVLAMQEWAAEYGEPPAGPDWNPYHARYILHDEKRAVRSETSPVSWPRHSTVYREFSSWNAALKAAGFQPRAPYGNAANQRRRRSMRAKAAA